MAKNDQKKKSGLHKDISSIFDGVPVPSDRTAPRPQTEPKQGQAAYDSPRPPAQHLQPPQNPQIPGSYQRSDHPVAAKAETKGALQRIGNKLFPPKPGVNRTKQYIMLLLVPILLVVFVIKLGGIVDIPFLTTKEPATSEGPDSTPPVAVSSEIKWQKPALYPTELRDPMKVPGDWGIDDPGRGGDPPPEPVDKLAVTGIIWSPDKPSAVIGIKIAHEGDIIDGATVMKINKKSVEFNRDGEAFTKTLEPLNK